MKAVGQFLVIPFAMLKIFPAWLLGHLPSMELKDILPIGINISRGAIMLGTDSTPSIFIVNFRRATGQFGIQPVRDETLAQIYWANFPNYSHDRLATLINKFTTSSSLTSRFTRV